MGTVYAVIEGRTDRLPGLHPLAARRPRTQERLREAVKDFADSQTLNATRHVEALRPYRADEFGPGPAAPSEAHIQAANGLIGTLRRQLMDHANQVRRAADAATRAPTTRNLHLLLDRKDRAGSWVKE